MNYPQCEICESQTDEKTLRVSPGMECCHKSCMINSDQTTERFGSDEPDSDLKYDPYEFIIGSWVRLDDKNKKLTIHLDGEISNAEDKMNWFIIKNSYGKYRLIIRSTLSRTATPFEISNMLVTTNSNRKIIIFDEGTDEKTIYIETLLK